MFDHLLESSHRDDSNKWSDIGFGKKIKELALIEIYFMHLICRSAYYDNTSEKRTIKNIIISSGKTPDYGGTKRTGSDQMPHVLHSVRSEPGLFVTYEHLQKTPFSISVKF